MANVILISYDNGSHIPFFPINLFYLTGALVNKGHEVKIIYQDLHHFADAAITMELDYEFKNHAKCDIVGLGFVGGYYQYAKAKGIAQAVNRNPRRKDFHFTLGGHGPAADPEYFIQKLNADSCVVGDGEQAIVEIAETNRKGTVIGQPTTDSTSPTWLYAHFPVDIYSLIRWPTSERTDFCMPILSSRGCKWHCSFCYRMREGFFERETRDIIDEIRYLRRRHSINHFQFADELLMSSERRVEEICEAILGLSFKIKWDCNGRLNYATKETLGIMKRSGCEYVNYGIESLNQSILNQMGKGLTLNQITQGIEDTLTTGLSPGINLLWGFPGDSVQNLNDAVEFIIRYDPCDELRTIRPVTPYPGTPLFKKAQELGLVKDTQDFYKNLHKNSDLITINFMDIDTSSAHHALSSANHRLYQNYLSKRGEDMAKRMHKLYYENDTSFRGFRAV